AKPQVTHDHPRPRDAIHLAQQPPRIRAREVMQDLRAHHDIDAAVGEWKAESIPANRVTHRVPARNCELACRVETYCPEVQATLFGNRPRTAWDVAQARSNVEQRRVASQRAESILDLVDRRADPAE